MAVTVDTKGIQLGDNVKEIMTGLTGIIDSMHVYLNGCIRFGIRQRKLDKDGKPLEVSLFDSQTVIATGGNILTEEASIEAPKPTGGPHDDPIYSPEPHDALRERI